jgi:hypothetical protein
MLPLQHWADLRPRRGEVPTSTPHLKQQFLDKLRATGNYLDSARMLDIEPSIIFHWRTSDLDFAKEWDRIIREQVLPVLEAEALRRAVQGSDNLLIFLLKAHDRERYDDAVARVQAGPAVPRLSITITDVSGGPLDGRSSAAPHPRQPPEPDQLDKLRGALTDAAINAEIIREDELDAPGSTEPPVTKPPKPQGL